MKFFKDGTEPLVSVLMPVYNGERYLCQAVDSILAQTFPDFEFIIVDDGSTDGTPSILRGYAAQDARIVPVNNDQNMGLPGSLNKGLALAKGEYVARMDADDISVPERLAKQVDYMDRHPEIGVLGCAVQVIDSGGNPEQIWRFPSEHGLLRWHMCFTDPIAHPTVMMRQDAVSQVGGYNWNMIQAEDYDLWWRLGEVTRLANLQEVLHHLRRHDTCFTTVHRTQLREKSIRVSQLVIARVLGRDIPIQVVRHLWNGEFGGSRDVRRAAYLICELYEATVADDRLTLAERRAVRRDAARRLLDLARQPTRNGYAWDILGLVCRLDPVVLGQALASRFHRLVREPCGLGQP